MFSGVGIEADVDRLFRDWKIEVNGWIELRNVCINWSSNRREEPVLSSMRLKYLAAVLFGSNHACPYNDRQIRRLVMSDWTLSVLSNAQLEYASWDAQIAIDMFTALTMERYDLGKC